VYGKMTPTDGMERMRKEAVVAYFKILSRNLSGGTKKKHEKSYSG
jgi:hypothetical protein